MRQGVVIVLAGAVMVAACFSPSPTDPPCTFGDPTCVAGVDAPMTTADAPQTIDGCPATCVGDTLTACSIAETCEFGCAPDGTPRCFEPLYSNGLNSALFDEVPPSDVGVNWQNLNTVTINADSGAIARDANSSVRPAGLGYDPVSRIAFYDFPLSDGRTAGLFVMRGWQTDRDSSIEVIGHRPVIFFVNGDVTLVGDLRLPTDCDNGLGCPGPGGGNGGSQTTQPTGSCAEAGAGAGAAMNGLALLSYLGGGGGGGNGTAGAPGGGINNTEGIAGLACDSIQPLAGGGGGGFGFEENLSDRHGGGGGGALQLASTGAIRIEGILSAPGAGGMAATMTGAGSGGGAGGTIILEAASVQVLPDAGMFANGGGGGASGLSAEAGEPGGETTARANGGSGIGASGGDGGSVNPPTVGSSNLQSGGGGGAAGRILIRTIDGYFGMGTASPTAFAGTLEIQ